MRTIKPLRLAVLPRCYENAGRCHMAVSVVFYFPFAPHDVLLPEMSMWAMVAEEMGTAMPIDECMPKAHPEVLVFGHAYAPSGREKPVCKVRVSLGTVDKSLYAIGERRWERSGAASDPQPFTVMPIDWTRAFGGKGWANNPDGKGFAPVEDDAGQKHHPLPNIEVPGRLVTSPNDRPEPAGFGGFPLHWPQRMSKAGTYDEHWLENLAPGYAKDMDWSIFNVAPADQWLSKPLQGDEAFVVENMHPDRPKIESRLPGVRARCFVNRRTADGFSFREVETRLDTVMLFPHRQRGMAFWRGVVEVAEDDGADIEQVVAAAEVLGEPLPESHYHRAMVQRSDEKTRHLFALKDSELVPVHYMRPSGLPDHKLTDMEDLLAREGLLEKNMRVRAELALEAARDEARAAGFDPDEKGIPATLPQPEKVPSLEEMPEFHEKMTAEFDRLKGDAEKKRDEIIADARAECDKLGLDYDAAVAKAQKDSAGPPRFRAADELARLRDTLLLADNAGAVLPEVRDKLADPELEQKLIAAEKLLFDGYRRHAHLQAAAGTLGQDEGERVRSRVLGDKAAGRSLAGVDLTGADLSGMDLRALDFREALMECVNLSGSDLSRANFTGTCLVRATFAGASIAGARFCDANLGGASLREVKGGAGVDMSRANLGGADLTGADLTGVILSEAKLFDVIVKDTRFDGVVGEKLIFMKTALPGASFVGAHIDRCVFLQCDVAGVDFGKASLKKGAFVETRAAGANFREADVTNLRAVKDTDFSGADFSHAIAERSNFRGCDLRRASFQHALLNNADLSECDARGASFDHASATEALFIRTDFGGASLVKANLMMALLQKAKIRGADFSGANLFRADFARVDGDEATKFERANMNQIRFVRRGGRVG